MKIEELRKVITIFICCFLSEDICDAGDNYENYIKKVIEGTESKVI